MDACVTSRRVVQGIRTADASTFPEKVATASMCPYVSAQTWKDGPWQDLQKTPLHVDFPPSSSAGREDSSVVIQA